MRVTLKRFQITNTPSLDWERAYKKCRSQMNRIITFSLGLLFVTSTAAASCPREDVHAFWSLVVQANTLHSKDLVDQVAQELAAEAVEALAPFGVVEIDPAGPAEFFGRNIIREITPTVLDAYVDQSCEIYRDQPIAELVQFLQTSDGQWLLDPSLDQDQERAGELAGNMLLRPSPFGLSWDELLSFFIEIVELEEVLSAQSKAAIAQIVDQISFEDRLADMLERRDIVSFKSEKHRELAIKEFRNLADMKRLQDRQ